MSYPALEIKTQFAVHISWKIHMEKIWALKRLYNVSLIKLQKSRVF